MSADYEPGTVVMARVGCHAAPLERLVKCEDGDWVRLGARAYVEECLLEDIRPLLVLDPEDAEQIGALADAIAIRGGVYDERVREAISDLIAPKPDEPQGLGAVVEDRDGNRYIRYGASLAPWIGHAANDGHDPDRPYRYWSGIDAVRILSEGVTA